MSRWALLFSAPTGVTFMETGRTVIAVYKYQAISRQRKLVEAKLYTFITLQTPVVTIYTTHFNVLNLCILPTDNTDFDFDQPLDLRN
jgi:hypothetical protein